MVKGKEEVYVGCVPYQNLQDRYSPVNIILVQLKTCICGMDLLTKVFTKGWQNPPAIY